MVIGKTFLRLFTVLTPFYSVQKNDGEPTIRITFFRLSKSVYWRDPKWVGIGKFNSVTLRFLSTKHWLGGGGGMWHKLNAQLLVFSSGRLSLLEIKKMQKMSQAFKFVEDAAEARSKIRFKSGRFSSVSRWVRMFMPKLYYKYFGRTWSWGGAKARYAP